MNDTHQSSSGSLYETDRKSRLTIHRPAEVQSLRERAASQPPRTGDPPISSSPLTRNFDRYNAVGALSWSQSSRYPLIGRSASLGMPHSVPTRSSSFSNDHSFKAGSGYNSFRNSIFASTFEDDESEVFSDDTGQQNFDSLPDFPYHRQRPYSPDTNRSRSQSLAGLRTSQRHSLGFSIPGISNIPQSWKETSPYLSEAWRRTSTHGQGEFLNSSGAMAHQNRSGFVATSPLRSSGLSQETADISNISPFLRDVNQIFADEGGMIDPWRSGPSHIDEGWNPGSGTTSRRHSVSIVQPRRGTLGLSSPEFANDELGLASRVPQLPRDEDVDLSRGVSALKLAIQEPPPSHRNPSTGLNPISPNANRLPQEAQERFRGRSLKFIPEGAQERSQFIKKSEEPGRELDLLSPRHDGNSHAAPVQPQPDALSRDNFSNLPQQNSLSELGKGIPLRSIPSTCPLYIVEFKAGRTDLFYLMDPSLSVAIGDLVIVEADRGRDLGKVINDTITAAEVEEWQQNVPQYSGESPGSGSETLSNKPLNPKRIYGRASSKDTQSLLSKSQDEEKALQLCQSKVQQKRLPMEVIDAEYQWDRRKLTFYFIAEKRIDFRELVRELFRLYKTRIWMASLSQTPTMEQ